jgi:hypothetical protein
MRWVHFKETAINIPMLDSQNEIDPSAAMELSFFVRRPAAHSIFRRWSGTVMAKNVLLGLSHPLALRNAQHAT